jgi:hypothetical protein
MTFSKKKNFLVETAQSKCTYKNGFQAGLPGNGF